VNDLTYFHAIVLGALQGFTEFLPISSSAHLALAQGMFRLDPASRSMLVFDVCVHVGTVLAILIVLARPTGNFLERLIREMQRDRTQKRYAWNIVVHGLIASAATAAIGLGFRTHLEAVFARPPWIGVCLIVTGVLLFLTRYVPRGRCGWGRVGWQVALFVGMAQGVAILPGISRSGATICTALFFGLRRRWAAEFSFFIAVPAILGAAVVQLFSWRAAGTAEIPPVAWGPMIAGSLAALLVGVVALKILLGAVRMRTLHYFAPYCFVLGILVVVGTF